MKKVFEKLKKYEGLIIITLAILVICLISYIVLNEVFLKGNSYEDDKLINSKQYFETPDRIVYKEKGEDKYYVFTSQDEEYQELINQLTISIDSIDEGTNITSLEISDIENSERYLELDYNTISKNYVIAYEKDGLNVIKRNDMGGKLIKANIRKKEELSNLVEEVIKDTESYSMSDSKEYEISNEFNYDLIEKSPALKYYQDGIYGIKIEDKETFDRIVENYGININGNITDETFDKTDVIIIFSKWEVSNITSRVGGITFTFTGYKNNGGYCGTLYLASKAINTNCIYRDTTNISNESIESDETSESNLQVDTKYNVSITKEQASDIADAEAKNQKYQYQPWVSDFTSKNILSDGSEGNEISAELLYELDEIHRIYYWEEEWEKRDSNGNKLYYGQPMWCVRLGDKNDPLTSLYIYVDANNGNILGAGKASD